MAVTLRDVAGHAGVSVRTVSNVVNGFPHVSPDMRAKVQASLKALDYRPNLLARSLRSGRTGVIALVMPEVREPYFGELAHETIEQARALGWTVLMDETDGSPEHEAATIDIISRSRMVDGLILSLLGLPANRIAAMNPDLPVVLLGERSTTRLDHVTIDNVGAARAATEHLIGRGRRRVAVIGREAGPSTATARLRLRGYRQALAAAGLRIDPTLEPVVHGFHLDVGTRTMSDLLALPDPPDAVFAFNDTLALGALRGLHEHGLRAGRDVLVVGFDDIDQAAYSVPSLSSVSPDKAGIAREALGLMHARLLDPSRTARRRVAGYELCVRESSGLATPARSRSVAASGLGGSRVATSARSRTVVRTG